MGAEAGQATEDFIVVRGTSSDVDRVVKEILKIVESAKNDEIVNSYVRVSCFMYTHLPVLIVNFAVHRVRCRT